MIGRETLLRAMTLVVLVGCCGGVPGSARADLSDAPTRADRARQLFHQGRRAYSLSDFATALSRFEASMKLHERASVALNIAQCHRMLGQSAKALFYYRLHLTLYHRENKGESSKSSLAARTTSRSLLCSTSASPSCRATTTWS